MIFLNKNLQLIGTTALFLACKIEEIFTPRIELFIIATDDAYFRGEILETERKIVTELEWNLLPQTIECSINNGIRKWDNYLSNNPNTLKDIELVSSNEEIDEADLLVFIEKYGILDISMNFADK